MNCKIPFHELASLLAANCSISPEEAEDFIKNFFDQIAGSLEEGESVKIKGIGTFQLSGEKDSPVSFSPDAEIADTINAPFALFEPEVLSDTLSDETLADIDTSAGITEPVNDKPSSVETSEDDKGPQPDLIFKETNTENLPSQDIVAEKNEENLPDEADIIKNHPIDSVKETTQEVQHIESQPEMEQETIKNPVDEPHATVVSNMITSATSNGKSLISTTVPTPSFPEEGPEEYLTEPPSQKSGAGFGCGLFIGILVGLALGACAVYFAIDYIVPTPVTQESVIEDSASDEEFAQVLAEAEAVLRGDTASSVQTISEEPGPKDNNNEVKISEEPVPQPKPEDPMSTPKAEPIRDTVKAGYLLHDMAKKHYGNKCFWVYIYEENKAKISNPNRVSPGLVLVIPQSEKYGINASNQASIKAANEKASKILAKFPR